MTQLRRGFKSWCENAARGYRRELNLGADDPLDPRLLANFLKVRIWTPKQVPNLDKGSLQQLSVTDSGSWSAVTIQSHGKILIVVNDSHSVERQNNTLSHELSHVILEHAPAKAIVSADGVMLLNRYDLVQEEEADCLAGALLVPREALLKFLSQKHDLSAAAKHFKVTKDLLRMRYNLTGIARQMGYRAFRQVG